MYDIVNEEDETKEAFLARCVEYFREDWNGLTSEQLDSACEHVLEQDIPESIQGWEQLAQANNYNGCLCTFRDDNNMYAVIEFTP